MARIRRNAPLRDRTPRANIAREHQGQGSRFRKRGDLMASCLVRILRLVSIGVVGLILGIGYWQATDLGYFEHWTQLSEKPQDVQGYLGPPGAPIRLLPPARITSPCDFSRPEFSPVTNPPKEIVDCVQRLDVYADGDVRVTYVIDGDGRVWKWVLSHSLGSVAVALISSVCYGVLIASLVELLAEGLKMYVDRRRNREPLGWKRQRVCARAAGCGWGIRET